MGTFEERNTVFALLVVISQGHASLAEDAHSELFQMGIFGAQVGRWATSLGYLIRRTHRSIHQSSLDGALAFVKAQLQNWRVL
jgi:hypothetical protein